MTRGSFHTSNGAGAVSGNPNANSAGTRIVLADDHAIVRSGLRLLLEEAGFEIVAEAGDIGETVRKVRAYKPDVLLLDLSMPDGSSLAAIPTLLEMSRDTAIVVLTMQCDPAFAHVALQSGARAFVVKEAADTELVDAVRAAADGHLYLDPQLGASIAIEPPEIEAPPDGLSDRQLQVLKLIALGYANIEIAHELVLSIRTVEAHRSHLQHKLGLGSRAELVAYATEHGLIP